MTKRKSKNIRKLTMPVSESRDQGSSNAHVTLVEYGDYECPYCAQAYIIIKQAQERLVSKLRFVFRNFPVTKVRPHAYETALAAEAAGAQRKFWDMYDYLFKHGQLLTNDDSLGKLERILHRIIKKSDIENTKLQEFARLAAKNRLKTTENRKQFLYSLISDKNIQNLINENRVEDAKAATLELLNKWEGMSIK
jgi:hypothetical protein